LLEGNHWSYVYWGLENAYADSVGLLCRKHHQMVTWAQFRYAVVTSHIVQSIRDGLPAADLLRLMAEAEELRRRLWFS
jgi:hypothetical protein